MSQKLTVLFPDGHRKTLQVTPNTSLYQVLEDACRVKGYSVEGYSLKHYKTILSPGLTVRFANLPNNALLELVESEVQGPKTSRVTICLQTEDGSRQTQEFDSSASLWEMVLAFDAASAGSIAKNKSNSIPVCVYANAEYVGTDAMKTTSLRQIGLMSGRHMLRLLHRTPEGIGNQAYAGTGSPAVRPPTPTGEPKPSASQSRPPPRQQPQQAPASAQHKPFHKKPAPEIKLNVKDYRIGTESASGVKPAKSAASTGGLEMGSGRPLGSGSSTAASVRVPEAKGETVFLDDEGSLAFHAQTAAQAFSERDVPDDFFQHTVSDIKYLYKGLKAQRQAMEEVPLLTVEQRKERERQRKMATCGGVCVLRIHFPNRVVLQSLFSADDTIELVKARVRNFLRKPTSRFYLYSTPPRRVLGDNETLLEAGCCPTSIIFFGSDGDSTNGESFLNDHVMANLSTAAGASSWASSKRAAMPAAAQDSKAAFAEYLSANAVKEAGMEVDTASGQPSNDRQPAQAEAPAPVPKWFKLGK